jgi:hypothetical protein
MAGMFNNKVMSALNKGYPSSFYPKDKPNPVFTALEQETTQFVAYMKKRATPGFKQPEGESFSRPYVLFLFIYFFHFYYRYMLQVCVCVGGGFVTVRPVQ